eukprot:5350421-Pyramimonas_sp.AAC.1
MDSKIGPYPQIGPRLSESGPIDRSDQLNFWPTNSSEDCVYLRAKRVLTNSPVTPTKQITMNVWAPAHGHPGLLGEASAYSGQLSPLIG